MTVLHYSNNGDSLNNIIRSFCDEAADHVRYSILKDDARNGGNMDLAALYEELANEEFNHAKIWYKEAFKDKENEELARSIANETQAAAFGYTEKAKKAELEGYEDLADRFLANGKAEAMHRDKLIVKILKRAKIQIYNYFVIGLPWETEETVEETIKFAIELDSDFISFYTATPLPGTRFYDYAMQNKLFDLTASFDSAYYYPVIRTHKLSKERVFELHKQAIKRFYLRPAYLFRTVLRLRTFAEFKNYFTAGLNLLLRK